MNSARLAALALALAAGCGDCSRLHVYTDEQAQIRCYWRDFYEDISCVPMTSRQGRELK